MLVSRRAAAAETTGIRLTIARGGRAVFDGATTLAQMKRSPKELVSGCVATTAFRSGCFLLTGTGIVPPDEFTLASGDDDRDHHRPHRHAGEPRRLRRVFFA